MHTAQQHGLTCMQHGSLTSMRLCRMCITSMRSIMVQSSKHIRPCDASMRPGCSGQGLQCQAPRNIDLGTGSWVLPIWAQPGSSQTLVPHGQM